MIANKKQEIASAVHELREQTAEADNLIAEKAKFIYQVIGGELLQGSSLKSYVESLRSQSVIYKQLRSRLQGINAEVAVSARTLDILYLLEPNLEERVEANRSKSSKPLEQIDNMTEVKMKCKKLTAEIDTKREEFARAKENFLSLRGDVQFTTEEYETAKEAFLEATGLLSEDVRKIEDQIAKTENSIKEMEAAWKKLGREIEKNERILQKVDSGDENDNFVQSLSKKVDELENVKREQTKQVKVMEKERDDEVADMHLLNETYKLLQEKLNVGCSF